MKKISERQKTFIMLLEMLSVDGKLITNNSKLAIELKKRGMSGYNGVPLHHSSVRRFLIELERHKLIEVIGGKGRWEKLIIIK